MAQPVSPFTLFNDAAYTATAAAMSNNQREAWDLLVCNVSGAYAAGITTSSKDKLTRLLASTALQRLRNMCRAWDAMADQHALITAYPPPHLQEQARIPGGNFAHRTHDELATACANSVHTVLQAVHAAANPQQLLPQAVPAAAQPLQP
jgi:hypothetical protein